MAMEEQLTGKGQNQFGKFCEGIPGLFFKGHSRARHCSRSAIDQGGYARITLTEVNSLTAAYITNTNRDILIEAPDKDKRTLPDEATVNSWLSAVEAENLSPYKDEVSALPLLSAAPVAGKIISETKNTAMGTTTLTLSNGVKVVLKPTDFKNDEIQFSAFAQGGTSLYSDADYQSAANADGIITAGGAGNYNANQLEKFLSGKELSVSPLYQRPLPGF